MSTVTTCEGCNAQSPFHSCGREPKEAVFILPPSFDEGDITKISVQLGPKLFSFRDEQDWVFNAKKRFQNCGVPKGSYIAIDAVGRVCTKGREFMRATSEDTYPITVYKLLID